MSSVVIKPIHLKQGIPLGTELVLDAGNYGAPGMQVQEILANQGHNMNTLEGCDLPDLNVEVKSRTKGSDSPHTIGTVSLKTIMEHEYEDTVIYEKSQHVYRVTHVPETRKISVVQETRLYDFSIPECQDKLREAYNNIRQKVRSGCTAGYIRGSKFGYVEKQASGSYQFRVGHRAMQTLEAISLQHKAYQSLFTDENNG